MHSLTDGELLDAVRDGNEDAYGILFQRHKDSALRVARRQTPDRHLAEDAVNEAFAAVLSAIRGGSGPVGIFAPYLLSSVTRTVHRLNRRSMRETPVMDTELLDDVVHDSSTVESDFDGTAAREAFKLLPVRWREVLWYLEIEEMPPRKAGPLLGLSPNATVALHRRAKEGLRLGYLQQHVVAHGPDNCKTYAAYIPTYVLGTLRKSRKVVLEEHLETCDRCGAVLLQIQDVARLRAAILPALLTSPLADIFPSGTESSGAGSANGQARDALLTSFVAVMTATALAFGVLGLNAAANNETSQGIQESAPSEANRTYESTQQALPESQLDVLAHNGRTTSAAIRTSLPKDLSDSTLKIRIVPSTGVEISTVTPDPQSEWTCNITSEGITECQAAAPQTLTFTLILEVSRPSCQEAPLLSFSISGAKFQVHQQNWSSPCTGE